MIFITLVTESSYLTALWRHVWHGTPFSDQWKHFFTVISSYRFLVFHLHDKYESPLHWRLINVCGIRSGKNKIKSFRLGKTKQTVVVVECILPQGVIKLIKTRSECRVLSTKTLFQLNSEIIFDLKLNVQKYKLKYIISYQGWTFITDLRIPQLLYTVSIVLF